MTTIPQEQQSSGGLNLVPLIAFGVMSLVFGFIVWLLLPVMGILPEAASVEATRTDGLFRVLMGIGGVVFFLVQGLIYYAAVAFRAKPDDTSDGPNIHGNVMLEIVWTIIPSLIVVFLAIYSYAVWVENTAVPESPNAMMTADSDGENIAINAIGQRYAWSFEYITNDFGDVINDDESVTENAGDRLIIRTGDLYIYAGQSVDIEMNTIDVIHSFWAPEMRVKQDLLPGRTTNVRFTPQVPTTNEGWDYVMVHTPVTLYAEPSFDAEIVMDMPLEEGALPEPVELPLFDNSQQINIAEGEIDWLSVMDERGREIFYPLSGDETVGRYNRYRLICTELCGGGHGDMYTDIIMFENREQFETVWYEPTIDLLSVPAGDPFELADNVIDVYPCSGCHVLSSREGWAGAQGPSLDGMGSRSGQRAQASGDAIGNEVDPNAEYIAQSIRLSQDYLVSGYGAIMPYYHPGTSTGEMPQEDLNAIIAYLCTQTASEDPNDSDCGFVNWEFNDAGEFTGDVDALVEELNAITDQYED
ncbi:MAG: cytochrome c oxidase subunit II transmembrane domain-containing protein [Chloroflexota bacterium]